MGHFKTSIRTHTHTYTRACDDHGCSFLLQYAGSLFDLIPSSGSISGQTRRETGEARPRAEVKAEARRPHERKASSVHRVAEIILSSRYSNRVGFSNRGLRNGAADCAKLQFYESTTRAVEGRAPCAQGERNNDRIHRSKRAVSAGFPPSPLLQ